MSFDTGRQQATLEHEELIHLGSGLATHLAVSGDLLAVSSARSSHSRGDNPAKPLPIGGPIALTPWYGTNSVDLYRLEPDGSTVLLANVPLQYPAQLVKLDRARLYISDIVGVAAYNINRKKNDVKLAWKYAFPNVQQIEYFGSFLLLRTADTTQVVEDAGNSCVQRTDATVFSKQLAGSGELERLFVISRSGECNLYSLEPSAQLAPFRDIPLFGNVLSIANFAPHQLLVLDDKFGLRLLNTQDFTRKARRGERLRLPESFEDPRFATEAFKTKYLISELPLPAGQVSCYVFGNLVYLLDTHGKLSTVTIDPQTRQLGKPQVVDNLNPVAEIAGDAKEQAAVGRDGTVTRLREGKVLAQLPSATEAGAWFEHGGQLYVVRGAAIHAIDKGTWGAELFRDKSRIVDIATAGSQVWLLSEQQLTAAEMKDGKLQILSSVAVPPESIKLRLGPTHAAVVHGDRGLLLVDARDPKQLKIASDRTLEMPTHSELPSKTGDDKTFSHKLRDVLVEANRVFVVGTEVFLYDLAALAKPDGDVRWVSQWHRPYVSGDDTTNTTSITPLDAGRYLVTAYLYTGFPFSRAYIVSLKGNEFADWRYCRLGAACAVDVKKNADGLTVIAAGLDGVRLLRIDETDSYLGSEYEPGEECQAVLVLGDKLYTKSGNVIRRYQYRLENVEEPTAFTFAARNNSMPKIVIDGLEVTSAEYQYKMGYHNRLKLVETDLSDSAGFPRTVVPQGTVAVDSKLGRIKFADGRNQEPKLLSRSEHINVLLAGWRKVGKYVVAALSEQSQGFAVMDLSDPTCMKVLSLAGQPNWFTYPHTVVASRDGYSYITGNIFNCLLPVNMKDPLHPHYERMINLKSGGVGKFACVTHYSGFFRGNRLFVPGGAGMTEVDVTDPTNIQRIAVHEKAAGIHQVLDEEQLAMRWNGGKLEYLDIADPANPQLLGSFTPENPAAFSPLNTVTVDQATYVLAATGRKQKEVFRIDASDMRKPKLTAHIPVAEDVKSILPEKGYLYLSGSRRFYVIDWQEPASPRQIAQLSESDFLGTWNYSYLDAQPRMTVVAGGAFGIDMQIEIKDGNTVWMSSMAAAYGVDVSDPARPKVVGSGPGFGESWWICTDDSDIVSIGSYRRAFIDIADPLKPRCLMEYYHGHPHEMGAPSNGNGLFQVGSESIWKWHRDEKTGEFRPEPGVLLPMWFGPDTQQQINGQPACLITGGNSRITKIHSAPLAVTPGETLVFGSKIRTTAGTDFSFINPVANVPNGIVTIAMVREDGKQMGNVIFQKDDGLWYPVTRNFVVPKDVKQMRLEIIVRGHAWFHELQLLRDGKNVLENTNFDQPLDNNGQYPHWTVAQAAGQRNNASQALEDCFYLPQGRDLLIYDLKKNSRFPVSRIAAGIHPDNDGPFDIHVRREQDRKIAYLMTYQGLVTIDVTDAYHPARLGTLSLPLLRSARPVMSSWRNCLVLVPGFTSEPLTEGFYVVDISNPAYPYLRSSAPGRRHSGVACHNGYLYLGDYDQGMQIWDITNPDRPKMITDQGFERCSQIHALEYHGNHVLRNEVGGLELWEAPVLSQAPEGKVTVE